MHASERRSIRSGLRWAGLAACLGGSLLLFALDVYGEFVSLRNPALATEPGLPFKNDIVLDADAFWEAARRRGGEDDRSYVPRVTLALSGTIAHYWEDDGVRRYNLRVPPHENWVLWLAGLVAPGRFGKYEFCDPEKAVERGVGLCSQQALVLEQVLERNGVEAKVAALAGHVVTLAEISGAQPAQWVLDPDFGVVLDTSLEELERDPSRVVPYYSRAGVPQQRIAALVEAYAAPGNVVFDGVRDYKGLTYHVESLSYAAKWLVPAALFLAAAWLGRGLRAHRPG